MRIYMAGPLGFSEAGGAFHREVLLAMVRSPGHEPLDPWMLTDRAKVDAVMSMPYGMERRAAWAALDVEIGHNNRLAIDRADAVVAVLDGVDVDSGTAAEIGYAFARGKPIVGYRGDVRQAGENEGCAVNLQVEYFIRQSGGTIVTRVADLPAAIERICRLGGPAPRD